MRNFIFGIVLVSILFSCNGYKEKNIKKTISVTKKTPVKDSVNDAKIVSEGEFKNNFDILLPRSYRSYEGGNDAASLTEKWIELYLENGEYRLGKANFKIEKDFDDCSGDSLMIIAPKNKVLVFMDYPELKVGKIESLKIKKSIIWPGEKLSLKFNNLQYDLRGEGKIISKSKTFTEDENEEDYYMVVEQYKLYLTIGNTSGKLLIAADACDGDANVQLLFAGDIDGDGKLDFVFGADRNYEEERVILFLSSKAENGEAVKKVSEIAVQFDC